MVDDRSAKLFDQKRSPVLRRGLQLFLGIPSDKRNNTPQSIYIPVEKMPLVVAEGIAVKVVMGTFGNTVNTIHTPEPVTFLDVKLEAGRSIDYALTAGANGTVYILSGAVQINSVHDLINNEAIAFGAASSDEKISIVAGADARLLFISGSPVAD